MLPQKSMIQRAAKTEKNPFVTLIYKDCPRALRQQFAAKCALLGLTQKEQVFTLMREWIAQEIEV